MCISDSACSPPHVRRHIQLHPSVACWKLNFLCNRTRIQIKVKCFRYTSGDACQGEIPVFNSEIVMNALWSANEMFSVFTNSLAPPSTKWRLVCSEESSKFVPYRKWGCDIENVFPAMLQKSNLDKVQPWTNMIMCWRLPLSLWTSRRQVENRRTKCFRKTIDLPVTKILLAPSFLKLQKMYLHFLKLEIKTVSTV